MKRINRNENGITKTIKELVTLHQQTLYHSEFDKMMHSVAPFLNSFQLNHFYYLRVLPSGHYTTLGTCRELHEYFLENLDFFKHDPCIRHPNKLKPGVFIENNFIESDFTKTINEVFEKFKMKFTIRVQRKIGHSCEIFGFATKLVNCRIEDALINNLFVVNKFIDYFIHYNKKLIQIAYDNQVNVLPLIGSYFYEEETNFFDLSINKTLLQQLGIKTDEILSKREKEILQYITNGYPASYIAAIPAESVKL